MADPHVYPEAPSAPLTLPVAVGLPTPTFTPIEQLAALDPSTPFIPKTMFIRVALSGADCASVIGSTAPNFYLRADTGDAVLINDHTQPANQTYVIFRQPGSNVADYIADGSAFLESNNVFHLVITFNDGAGNYAWQLGIWNNDAAAARRVTWVVSATLANTAQPWINVAPPLLSWDVLIGGSKGDSVTISNMGTGAFTVTSVTPALPAGFALGALPAALAPNTSAPLTVTFTGPAAPPPPNGSTAANAIVNITPADPTAGTGAGHNRQLSVSATTQALEIVLLLDDSGSMSWDPHGNVLPGNSPNSRWSELSGAVNQFLNLLAFFGTGHGTYGIARFPASNPANPSTYDLVLPTDIPDMAHIGGAQTIVSGVSPSGGTPMGDGIDRVFSPATSYFATDPLSISANRRWLLLMTDGAHNSGTHNPTEYILPPNGSAAPGTSFVDKKVTVFAIGYGVTGFVDVNPTLLQHLADGSLSGQIRRPNDDGLTAMQVASAFREAIKSGITPASSPGDPPAVFNGGQVEARHYAVMTHYDRRSTFVLNWNTPDSNRMRLELITPTCDLITPEAAEQGVFKDVVFRRGERFQMYLVGVDFLRNADDPGRPRYGTWTLRVLAPELRESKAGKENYDYDIIVESDLSMAVKLDRSTYHAGDAIEVSARLLAAGKPIKGASVFLSTTAPLQSVSNWLAGLTIPDRLLRQAQEKVHADSSPILVKTVAAQLAGLTFPGGDVRADLVMTDPDGIGTYQATVADTTVPETYTFYVTATGVTDDGVTFRREGKVTTNVLVQPDPAHTQVDLMFRDPNTVDILVKPRDRFGNVLLADPGTVKNFELLAKGAKFTGPMTSNVDGSYIRQLRYGQANAPEVTVKFNGHIVKHIVLPPLKTLHWVDRVVAFDPGAEAAKGTNQHTKPEAALGDIFNKPADSFVALGVAGTLAVAVNNMAVVAAGDDDVTVFLAPGLNPCAYRVEVWVPPIPSSAAVGPTGWVTIGTSAGVTQSFSLLGAKVRAAAAIRVTDLSKRTRGPDLRPLAAPGVGIRGIGVLKVSEKIPWGLDRHLQFLAKPDN